MRFKRFAAYTWSLVPSTYPERIGGRQGKIRCTIPSRYCYLFIRIFFRKEKFVLFLTINFYLITVEDSLKQLKEQTGDALTKVTEQSQRVDESLSSLETVLKDLKQHDAIRDEEFKNVKSDVESLKELVPRVSKMYSIAGENCINLIYLVE